MYISLCGLNAVQTKVKKYVYCLELLKCVKTRVQTHRHTQYRQFCYDAILCSCDTSRYTKSCNKNRVRSEKKIGPSGNLESSNW